MKAAFFADLAVLKKYQPQQIVIALILGLFVGIMTANSSVALAAVCVSVAYSLALSLLALDERNGWEQYRLSLPLSRRSIMRGRYASVLAICAEAIVLGLIPVLLFFLLGALVPNISAPSALTAGFEIQELALMTSVSFAIVMITAAITLPLNARFGMTRAVRYMPLAAMALCFLAFACMQVGGNDDTTAFALNIWSFLSSPEGALIAAAAIFLAGIALYAASYALSIRFYEKREF